MNEQNTLHDQQAEPSVNICRYCGCHIKKNRICGRCGEKIKPVREIIKIGEQIKAEIVLERKLKGLRK